MQHIPFTMTHRSTHTFWVSVALSSLDVREILHTRCESKSSYRSQFVQFEHHSDMQMCVLHCRCAPRLRPGRAALFVGLCDRTGRGEGQLPVCAAFGYKLLPDRTSVNLRRRYLQRSIRLPQYGAPLYTFNENVPIPSYRWRQLFKYYEITSLGGCLVGFMF